MTETTAVVALAGLLGACSFNGDGFQFDQGDGSVAPADASIDPDAPDIDAGVDPPDASPPDASPPDAGPDPIIEDIAHVPPEAEFAGTADLSINSNVTIDTTNLTYDGGDAPEGTVLDSSVQSSGGSSIAILHVKSLTVAGGVEVKVLGSRPFVVIASGDITVAGIIDASASRQTPGAGGGGPAQGQGAGNTGEHKGTNRDSGGGGGSYGSLGGDGGDATCPVSCGINGVADGGEAGDGYGDPQLTVLAGGSGGGASSPNCAASPPGAGGGAVQLYAGGTLSISASGGVHVGGGGGGRGQDCVANAGSASGGGSGGAIFLQSPTVQHAGTLAANGGGGGGSAAFDVDGTEGIDGEDGPYGTARANGGPAVGGVSQKGGDGATGLTAATDGGSDDSGNGNGGGGGGGVGRIVIIYSTGSLDDAGSTNSPTPVTGTY